MNPNNPFELPQNILDILEKSLEETKTIEMIQVLERINYQISELKDIKEALEAKLSKEIHGLNEGARTYEYGKYKVTVTTGFNYRIDKEEYMINGHRLSACLDPVRTKTVYEIDKKQMREIKQYMSLDDQKILATFVTEEPKKVNVRITSGA